MKGLSGHREGGNVPVLRKTTEANLPMSCAVKKSILTLLAAIAPQWVLASADALFSESDFLSELPVVLSATRLRQPISETPAAMTVIDREMIRDSGAWDVADLFRLVPGMYVAYNVDKEIVPGHVVSYHGLADPYAKRMQILVDGRSVYTPLFGGPIWSNIPLSLADIERVEVVRGPSAASFGANSFLGVINIVTRDPAETQGRLVSLSAGRQGGDATLRYGGRSAQMAYRLTLQLRGDSGYTINPDTPRDVGTDTHPRTDNKRIGNLSLRSDWHLSARDDLQFQFGYSGGTRGTGDTPQPNPRREKRVDSQYESLRWQRDVGPEQQFSVRVYHNRDAMREDSSRLFGNTVFGGLTLGVPTPFNEPIRHVAERLDAELEHSFAPAESLRVVWGGGVRQDAVSSLLYLGSSDYRVFLQQSLFGNLEWRPWRALSINVGAMLEHNSFVGTKSSPRLAANYHLTATQTLRASLSRSYRNPVLFEEQGNGRWVYPSLAPVAGLQLPLQYIYGPQNLRPERIDSRELGYLFELGGGSSVDLKYSYDTLTDLIEPYIVSCPGGSQALCALTTPGTKIRTFENGGATGVRSFEVQWQQRIGEGSRMHLGWSTTRMLDTVSAHLYAYGDSMPRNSLNLLVAHQLTPHWRASVGLYRSAATRALSGDALPAYTRWDARLARQFRWAGSAVELALIVQNLGDSRYQEFYADNVWGRRAYANLNFEF